MDAENFTLTTSSATEIIEDFCAVFPGVGVSVLSDGLVVEAVDGGDLACLVVASQQRDVGGVFHLEAEKELEGLHGIESTIDKVSHENVACVWDLATFVEQFQQVVELAMNVTADGDGSLDWLDVAFLNEDLFDFFAEDAEFALRKNGSLLDGLKPVVDVVLAHF